MIYLFVKLLLLCSVPWKMNVILRLIDGSKGNPVIYTSAQQLVKTERPWLEWQEPYFQKSLIVDL